MTQVTNLQNLLADKERYYEEVTRRVRWLAIVIVAATFPVSHPQYHWLLGAIGLGTIFNGLRYSKALLRWKLFASRITTLVMDNLLIAILMGLSGGIHSPYIIFWIFTLISASYWYGQKGAAMVLAWQALVTLVLLRYQYTASPSDTIRVALLEILSLIAVGILAERLTHADRSERLILAIANRQAESERSRLLSLVNSLIDPVVTIGPGDQINIYNGAALDLLNTNQQITGKHLGDFLHLQDAKGQPVPLASILGKTSVVKRRDLVTHYNDGTLANLDLSVAPIYGQASDGKNYILIIRDITKQKSLDQEREEFIAVTSHELKTPVAIAEANLSTALLPNFDQMGSKARELVTQAHQNIMFLGELIADLSTLSKAEQGRLEIEIETIDPTQLINSLAEDYSASAKKTGLELKTRLGVGIKPFQSSPSVLHEILQNFITNAIKYTEKGSVTLAAELSKSGEGIIFSVADTGIGISASDKKKLFSKFYRSEDYRTRKHNGTGLGLYITLKLAQRLNAKIWYRSRPNLGSTFYLEIPIKHPGKQVQPSIVKAAIKDLVEE